MKAEVAAWEAGLRGRSSWTVGAPVADDLLVMWQETRARQWQPTIVRVPEPRAAHVIEDLGNVRLLDLDPLRVDLWLA